MAERKRKRSRSSSRNSLYDEPSPWGVIVFIAIVVAVVAIVLIVLGSNTFYPAGFSGGDRLG